MSRARETQHSEEQESPKCQGISGAVDSETAGKSDRHSPRGVHRAGTEWLPGPQSSFLSNLSSSSILPTGGGHRCSKCVTGSRILSAVDLCRRCVLARHSITQRKIQGTCSPSGLGARFGQQQAFQQGPFLMAVPYFHLASSLFSSSWRSRHLTRGVLREHTGACEFEKLFAVPAAFAAFRPDITMHFLPSRRLLRHCLTLLIFWKSEKSLALVRLE